jgi:hypothetical protein
MEGEELYKDAGNEKTMTLRIIRQLFSQHLYNSIILLRRLPHTALVPLFHSVTYARVCVAPFTAKRQLTEWTSYCHATSRGQCSNFRSMVDPTL